MISVSPLTGRVGIVFRPQLPPERLAGTLTAAAEAVGLDDLWLWEDCFLVGGLTERDAGAGDGAARCGVRPRPDAYKLAA